MSRSRRPEAAPRLRDRLHRVVIAAWLLAGAAMPCAASAAALEPVWLSIHPGLDVPAADGLLLRDERGGLWAQRDDLAAWGVTEPVGEAVVRDDTHWFALDAQRALKVRFDPSEQALWLQVDPQLRTVQVRSLRDTRRLDTGDDDAEVGGWIDADVQVARSGAGQSLQPAGLFAFNRFRGNGFANATALATRESVVRLDSTWSFERADALERIDLGDGIVRAGAWGRSLRFAGVSMGTDFSLQPDLVTFPQPELRGVAELPSTLDVYVNGMLARQERIDAGPFVLSDMPVQDGANRTRVVVRDMLGREQVLSQAFYAPAQLLRVGLRDTRLDAGWLREDYGLRGFEYGSGFVSASLREGHRDWLTTEWRGEGGTRRQAGGAAAAFALPMRLGTTELALAASRAPAGEGALFRAGYDWHGGTGWSMGARWRRPIADWTDLGEAARADARRQLSANVGFVPARGWTGALTWARLSQRDEPSQSLVSIGLGTRLGRRWHLGASFVRTESDDGDRDLRVGLTMVGSFGSGTTVIDSSRRLSGAEGDLVSMEWQRRTDDALDPSLRLRTQRGDDTDRLQAEGRWPGEHGQLDVALARDAATGGAAWRVGGATRMAWLGDDRFWTRAGGEGFTVIDTHGLADVGVLQDQRLAARTDDRGLALIPGLRPYEPNRFALVDADVPIEASVDALDRTVTPSARGAMRVEFPVRSTTNGRGFRLLLPDGAPVPPGTRVRDPYSGLRAAMGRDGHAWWPHGEGLPDRIEIERAHQTCEAQVPRAVHEAIDVEPVLRLVCREAA